MECQHVTGKRECYHRGGSKVGGYMKKNDVNALLKFHMHQEFAVVPIVLYVVLSGIIMICFHYYSMKALILAAILAILVGFLLCASKADYWNAIVRGLAQYGNARLIMIFMVIGIFSKLLAVGQIGSGFVWVGMHLHLRGGSFTVFCFLVSSLISMGAGAPIAALLAVVPIFYPAGVLMGADPAILTGAMLSGIFFGDALSPSSQVIHTTIASQHDPVTNKSADLLQTMKERLPYLIAAGIVSAVLFYVLGSSGTAQNPELLQSMCDPRGLWMLLPIVLLLIICFKTSDLFVGVTYAILAGIVIGLATGLFQSSDLINIHYDTQELHGILFDGISGVVDIIISTILLYGLISIAVEGGMMEKCCNYLTSRRAVQHPYGAEAVISIGVGIVNILLAGCVLPSILMFKDIADTIGKKANISPTRRSILLTAMTTNITAIIPINSAFVMGAVTVINQLAANHSYLPVITPFQIFLSSYYCLLLTLICVLWVVFGAGRKKEQEIHILHP